MKTLFKIITMLCAIAGAYFMAMAFIDRTTRASEDRLHIAQLKGKIPFGRVANRIKNLRGEHEQPDSTDEASVRDYRDGGEEEPEEEPAAAPSTAITAKLPRVAGKREAAEHMQRLAKYSTDAARPAGKVSEDDLEGLFDD